MLDFLELYWHVFFRILIEIVIVLIFIKFEFFRKKQEILEFDDKKIDQIVSNFSPLPLINTETENRFVYNYGELNEMADYDFYNLQNKFKSEMKEIIQNYGVGTCGPPGFYGTLDIHLDLEKKLSEMLHSGSAILYSNSFTCTNSLITCFCKFGDNVFYHKSCNEAILRGLHASKADPIEFEMKNLEQKLEQFWNEKKRNFLIIEGIFKNTGEILNIQTIINMKIKYPFHFIIDESLSIPLLGNKGIIKFLNLNYSNVDIIIGSFSHTFCATGGFVVGNKHIVDYQRLLSPAYCFSASMPGYLAKFIQLSLDVEYMPFTYEQIHSQFISNNYSIISDRRCPFIVIVMTENGLKNAIIECEKMTEPEIKQEKEESFQVKENVSHSCILKEVKKRTKHETHDSCKLPDKKENSEQAARDRIENEKNESSDIDKQFATNKANQIVTDKEENISSTLLDRNILKFNSTVRLSRIMSEFDLTLGNEEIKKTKTVSNNLKNVDLPRVAELLHIERKINQFKSKGFRVGFVYNPRPGIRICIKQGTDKEKINNLIQCMNEILK